MKDQNFWRAFKNTLLLNFKYLIISFPLTLIFALLLNEVKNVHFKKIVQTISYLPHFISMVIVAGMVREILSTSGPINNLITKLGGEAITFISLPEWFTTIFVTTGVWQGLGWGTILYLAAMSGINTELYEAAELDGANKWQIFWNVTLPQLKPTTFFVIIMLTIASFKVYDQMYMITQGGPGNATMTLVYYIYNVAFVNTPKYGYASAVSMVLFVLVLFVTIIQFKGSSSND